MNRFMHPTVSLRKKEKTKMYAIITLDINWKNLRVIRCWLRGILCILVLLRVSARNPDRPVSDTCPNTCRKMQVVQHFALLNSGAAKTAAPGDDVSMEHDFRYVLVLMERWEKGGRSCWGWMSGWMSGWTSGWMKQMRL